MATTSGLITVAEFEKIPDPPGGKYELRNRELVYVAYASLLHSEIQMAIAFELRSHVGPSGYIGVELHFKPTPEYNEWSADVAFVSRSRVTAQAKKRCFDGTPDLVIEIVSPSNTEKELSRREAICLANGCRQFWIADPDQRTIKVSRREGIAMCYGPGEEIDLPNSVRADLPLPPSSALWPRNSKAYSNSMATTSGPISVAEFEKIPDPPGGKYELRNGELVCVAYAAKTHQTRRMAIAFAIQPLIGIRGHVGVELGFIPTPEYNEWAADVAFVGAARWAATPDDKCLAGAPDLVIEVMSPSNTELEMNQRAAVCLANGCRQFWVVDPPAAVVKVSRSGCTPIIFKTGDEIDLAEFGGGKLAVASIFGEPR